MRLSVFIKTKRLVPKGFRGITFSPFIFLLPKVYKNEVVRNHERIHVRQQYELLWIGFYAWYLFDYLRNRYKYKMTKRMAYRNIIFEREAYRNQRNQNYLKERSLFGFIPYKLTKNEIKDRRRA